MSLAFVTSVVALMALAGCGSANDTQTPNVAGHRALRPYGTDDLTASMPDDAIYLFEHRDFKGNMGHVDRVTNEPAGVPQAIGQNWDKMSSLRWQLPPGVVVTLYEDAQGKGNQLVIWGRGQAPSVSPWRFNDKVSRWSWAYVGGAASPSESVRKGLVERPLDANPTANLADGTIEIFRDRDLRGNMTTLGPIQNSPMGVRQSMGAAADQFTSLRWNLPPGVVVVFYDNAGATGRQMVIWGKGQYGSVSEYGFNDKASRWAWYEIGK
jgi:hypothetical protein